MTPPAQPQPYTPTRGWWSLIIALVAFLGLPLLPTGLRSIVPIDETMVLLMAALAVCATIGWWKGGSALFALVWIALTAWMFVSLGTTTDAYGELARGWVLLLVAAFGGISLVAPAQGFFVRALSTVGIAIVCAFMLTIAIPDGVDSVHRTMQTEYSHRTEQTISWFGSMTSSQEWREAAKLRPALDSMVQDNETELRKVPDQAATVFPALLAIESLAALALAWALYHRLSATPIGPSLGPIREFRFNDQLIWGLAVGAAIFFLPQFAEGKSAGLNLLMFFGALYLLRGTGVLAWVSRGRAVGIGLIILTALVPLVVGVLALGVGVGDTWMDWRHRAQTAT